jgi:uncharacterized protein YueI
LTDEFDEVEERLIIGIHGTPELKRSEKILYLGEFRERVLKVLTKDQVDDSVLYPEIEEALKNPHAARLLLDGDLDYEFRAKYIKLARKYNKSYKVINDPDLKGEIGLVVASDQAVDVENIHINTSQD